MLAVDTNVVVRLLVNDDQRQGALARRLFETGDVFIGVTVLLESAWVLESVYELSPGDAAKVLRGLLGLPNVRVEDAGAVAAAGGAPAASTPGLTAMNAAPAAALALSRLRRVT